jgi:hypothetical protein
VLTVTAIDEGVNRALGRFFDGREENPSLGLLPVRRRRIVAKRQLHSLMVENWGREVMHHHCVDVAAEGKEIMERKTASVEVEVLWQRSDVNIRCVQSHDKRRLLSFKENIHFRAYSRTLYMFLRCLRSSTACARMKDDDSNEGSYRDAHVSHFVEQDVP